MTEVNEYKELALFFGRTLGRANLYGMNHPTIEGTLDQLLASIENIFKTEKELILATSEGNLLINSALVDGEAHLAGALSKSNLDSITINSAVTKKELSDLIKALNPGAKVPIEDALRSDNVKNIKVNLIHYVKTGEENNAPAQESNAGLSKSLEGLSFESMLHKVIDKAVSGEEDRLKVFEMVMKKFGNEVSEKIDEATCELEKEKDEVILEKEKTETVLKSSVQGLITVDKNGSVVMINHGGEKVVGSTLKKIAGKPVWNDLKEGHMVTLAKEGTGCFTVNDLIVEGEDETKRLIRASNALIRNVEGKMVGTFSALSDVTKYKELEQMKRDFAASVTHELRTPIVATKQALSNILALTPDMDKDQKKMLEISLRNTDRLFRLVNDILDFSKLDAGKMTIKQEIIETYPFLQEVITSLQPFAENKGVRLLLETGKALPRLYIDTGRTTQILNNLISNAVKFTKDDGTVTVSIPGMLKLGVNTLLRISVTDNGCGIASEDIEKIFEKFIQVGDKESTAMQGTGLGLNITRAMVELHGGQIDVKSEPGIGSVFTVALPMLPEDDVFIKENGAWQETGTTDRTLEEARPAGE